MATAHRSRGSTRKAERIEFFVGFVATCGDALGFSTTRYGEHIASGCNPPMRNVCFVTLMSVALLGACALGRVPSALPPSSAPVAVPPPPAPAVPGAKQPAAAQPAPRVSLASEQSRLAELFRDTGVVFVMQTDGAMRVTVPRKFSFDAGTTKVKPPLAAVLDRVARIQVQMNLPMRIAAPTDPDVRSPTLARNRGASVREYFVGQGVDPSRMQSSGATQAEIVEIVVSDAPH
jgi:outer membrane protein OmpA-like peptidoglycan-associated protein